MVQSAHGFLCCKLALKGRHAGALVLHTGVVEQTTVISLGLKMNGMKTGRPCTERGAGLRDGREMAGRSFHGTHGWYTLSQHT